VRLVFVFFCLIAQSLFAGYADFEAAFKANPEKHQKWQEMAETIDRTTDRIGCPIDEKIKEIVIVLNLLGFRTSASCEGHLDEGLCYPWVAFDVEQEGFEALDKELNVIHQKIRNLEESEENLELDQLYARSRELFNLEQKYLLEESLPLCRLLEEFYHSSPSSYAVKIIPDLTIFGNISIYSWDGEWQLIRQEEEKKAKLLEYRQEMEKFTDFLIKRFLQQSKTTN